MALKCISYLRSNRFDLNVSDGQIDRFILQGDYILLDYVTSHWVRHIQDSILKQEILLLADLDSAINGFMNDRQNLDFETSEQRPKIFYEWAERLSKSPDLREFIVRATLFQDYRRRLVDLRQGK